MRTLVTTRGWDGIQSTEAFRRMGEAGGAEELATERRARQMLAEDLAGTLLALFVVWEEIGDGLRAAYIRAARCELSAS